MKVWSIWFALILFLNHERLYAQGQTVLRARVLFQNGTLVQLDQGSESGVEPGDLVLLRPLGAAEVRGVVQSVERRSAWVELRSTSEGIEIGTPAEITIAGRPVLQEKEQSHLRKEDSRLPSAAPKWTSPETGFDATKPLLTDPVLPTVEELPSEWSGRAYILFDTIHNRSFGSTRSTFARSGARLDGDNPFGHGGAMRLDFEYDLRSFRSTETPNESISTLRLERFSYRQYDTRNSPLSWQAGRFLPSEFPEFGVLDGGEVVYRRNNGHKLGMSAGFLPDPSQQYSTGNDLQIATTYRARAGEKNQYRWALGFQKSWHDGTPDRDLAIAKFDYLPGTDLTWSNSVWIDFYSASDLGKGSGPEISLLTSYLNWNRKQSGSSLGLRHWRLPQIDRFQSGTFTEDDVISANTSRLDLNAWTRLNPSTRLSGRADVWRSEDRSGSGGDVQIDLNSIFGTGSRSWLAAFANEGTDNQSYGLRAGQGIVLGPGRATLTWDGTRFRPFDQEGELLQHDLRLSWDYWSPSKWSLSLDAGRRFGDEQDSYSLGLYLQRSF